MLGAVDVLMGAGLVCRSWLDAAKLPYVWRVVEMEDVPEVVRNKSGNVMEAMAKAAVDRSDGQLRVFAGQWFVDHDLLKYHRRKVAVPCYPSPCILLRTLQARQCDKRVASDGAPFP
jgi:hypothetical protein